MAKNFYFARKKEIEDVIVMFQDRVEAEKIYAAKLHKIGL